MGEDELHKKTPHLDLGGQCGIRGWWMPSMGSLKISLTKPTKFSIAIAKTKDR